MVSMRSAKKKERFKKNKNINLRASNKYAITGIRFNLKYLIKIIKEKSKQEDKRDFLTFIFCIVAAVAITVSVFRFIYLV